LLQEAWQVFMLGGAAVLLLLLHRGVVTTLLLAATARQVFEAFDLEIAYGKGGFGSGSERHRGGQDLNLRRPGYEPGAEEAHWEPKTSATIGKPRSESIGQKSRISAQIVGDSSQFTVIYAAVKELALAPENRMITGISAASGAACAFASHARGRWFETSRAHFQRAAKRLNPA
jgi:hypothetical protein